MGDARRVEEVDVAGTGPEFVVVGRVGRPHGVGGELFVRSLTDRPEGAFGPGSTLFLEDVGGNRPDPGAPPLRIARSRPHREGFLIWFDGLGDRDRAGALRGRYLLRPFSETDPLEEGEVFHHQLLGLSVVTTEGLEVGRIREVYDVRPAILLEVEGEAGKHLIPFTEDFLVALSLDEGTLVIDPPEGLLDL